MHIQLHTHKDNMHHEKAMIKQAFGLIKPSVR